MEHCETMQVTEAQPPQRDHQHVFRPELLVGEHRVQGPK